MNALYLSNSSSSSSEEEEEKIEDEVCLNLEKKFPLLLPQKNWSPFTETFKLRSTSYLKDKKKEICENCMFDLLAVELLELESQVSSIVKDLPGGTGDTYLKHSKSAPFLFVVHFQLPGEEKLAFAAYFTAKPEAFVPGTPFSKLFKYPFTIFKTPPPKEDEPTSRHTSINPSPR